MKPKDLIKLFDGAVEKAKNGEDSTLSYEVFDDDGKPILLCFCVGIVEKKDK